MGADVETSEGRPPLTLHGRPLRGVSWDMDVASAQVKTAILLAGLQAEGVTTVREPEPSRDHTERLLPLFGAALERSGLQTSVRGGARLRSVQTTVPGDVSSAAFLIVAALTLPDSAVELDGVLLNPHRTAFLEVLRQMGADLEILVQAHDPEPVGRISARTSRLRGVEVPPALMPALIDEVPALAIAAARAEGRFAVSAAAELRVKESDRIAALVEGLRAMGARVDERDDGFEIEGGASLRGARVRSFDDHRIAMAFAVAALGADGDSEVEDGECASVSFPEFWQLLEAGCG
jgi:3-phosphoshikimate 1-carboxyvinyltransferase